MFGHGGGIRGPSIGQGFYISVCVLCGYLEGGCYGGKVSLQSPTCVGFISLGWPQWLSIPITELIELV